MELVATTQIILAREGEVAAQFLLEHLFAKRVYGECELFKNSDIFNFDDPVSFFACMIRDSEA